QVAARAGLAKVLAMTGKTEDALAEAKQVLDEDPNNLDALIARAESLLKTRQTAAARQDFERLNEKQPGNPYVLHRLGAVASQDGRNGEAIQYFRETLNRAPDMADALNDLLALHVSQGQIQQALQDLDRYESQAQRKDLYALFRGRLYLSQKDFSRAEASFRQATSSNPDNYQGYIFLSQVKLLQQNPQEAIREVDQLIEQRPDFAPGYMMKAYLQD